MSSLKAYICRIKDGECADIVFARSNNEARKTALKSGSSIPEEIHHYDGNRYFLISARRKKDLDQFAKGSEPYSLQFFTDDNIHIFRAAGFYQIDESTCSSCGSSDFGKEKYAICWGCDNCIECSEASMCKTCFLCSDCGHNNPDSEDFCDWQTACKGTEK